MTRTNIVDTAPTCELHPLAKDLTDQTFGRLTAIHPVKYQSSRLKWLCRCDCGNRVVVAAGSLYGNLTKSCGCLHSDMMRERNRKNLNIRSDPIDVAMRTVIRSYKGHANNRNLGWKLTEEQFKELTSSKCHYCGVDPKQVADYTSRAGHAQGTYTYNGIDRKDNEVGYTVKNCVSCCKRCNRAKDTMTEPEFLSWVRAIYEWSLT